MEPCSSLGDGEEASGSDTQGTGELLGAMDGSKPSNKSRIPGLYRPPTHTELQTLKETQDLFKSNLMKLQVRSWCLLAGVMSWHTIGL